MTPSPSPRHNRWRAMGLLASAFLMSSPLMGSPAPAAAHEAPPEPLEEVESFVAAGAAGMLVLPPGAPDRLGPVVVILQDGEAPDGRASLYTDQLLGAGFAVLEIVRLPGDSLEAVLASLAGHPRMAEQRLGLLGFGAGARLAAALPVSEAAPVAARALLYPGCDDMAPAAMPGQAVLLMHGGADPANLPQSCEALGAALEQAGAAVRLRVLDRATYAWDRPAFAGEGHAMLPRPDGAGRVRAEAWPALAQLSAAEVAGFFAVTLLGQRP